jgi:hypothetical protein
VLGREQKNRIILKGYQLGDYPPGCCVFPGITQAGVSTSWDCHCQRDSRLILNQLAANKGVFMRMLFQTVLVVALTGLLSTAGAVTPQPEELLA